MGYLSPAWPGLHNGQEHAERGSRTLFALHPDASVLGFGQGFCNGQSHAGIAHALNENIIGAVEAGEDAWQVFCEKCHRPNLVTWIRT